LEEIIDVPQKKDEGTERNPKRVYFFIDGKKVFIDPEIVKRYDLDKKQVSGFTSTKLYMRKIN